MDHKLRVDKKSNALSNLFYEGKQLPNFDYHRHHDDNNNNNNNSPGRHGNGSPLMSKPASPLPPYSPESLWSRSPVSLSYPSHPSLLHCCISSLHRDDGYIYSIVVLGDLVFTGSRSCRVHAWQSLDCHAEGYIHASSGEVRAMVAHGELLFTSHKDHKIRIWSMRSSRNGSSTTFKPKKVTTLPSSVSHFKNFISRPITPQHKVTSKPSIGSLHKDIISCMAHYNVEGLLYTGSVDKTVKAWRVNEKTCVDSFIAHQGSVNDMVINQQNGHLFTCSSDGTVKMWLRVYGENFHALIKVLTFNTYPVHALALSVSESQETFLYSGSSNGSISFWHQELSCRYTHGGNLQGHRFAVLCLATIEDLVITGSEDSTIKIWRRDLGGGNHNCLAVLEGHRGPVQCLAAYLQQDKFALSFLVYSASLDQAFKVWRVRVLPIDDMKKSPIKDDDNENPRIHNQGFETSHNVLSPSWVKKKLIQCRSLHNLI